MELATGSENGHPETPIYEFISRKHSQKVKRAYAATRKKRLNIKP